MCVSRGHLFLCIYSMGSREVMNLSIAITGLGMGRLVIDLASLSTSSEVSVNRLPSRPQFPSL